LSLLKRMEARANVSLFMFWRRCLSGSLRNPMGSFPSTVVLVIHLAHLSTFQPAKLPFDNLGEPEESCSIPYIAVLRLCNQHSHPDSPPDANTASICFTKAPCSPFILFPATRR